MNRPRPVLTILAVSDLEASLNFYRSAFDWPIREKTPVYAELQMPGSRLGLYERNGFGRNLGRTPRPAEPDAVTGTELYFHCSDPGPVLERLERAGGRPLSPLSPRPWGEEVGYQADPDGNVLAIARGNPPAVATGRLSIEPAAINDFGQVTRLLQEAGLPLPDPTDPPVEMVVGRLDGAAVACAGWESYDSGALYRSMAVDAGQRGRGIGAEFLEGALELLRNRGTSDVWLLTVDAAQFFGRFGFETVRREDVPNPVRASPQFSLVCCRTATAMHRSLR
ncbi:MAG: GNAT family N-acetyltransferase [Armatimonadetes bacterium]|nr:GNAT family N-acetyltransferase [Armatimonadota bacterium]